MKITKRQLRKIIREAVLNETYFSAESEDGSWSVDAELDQASMAINFEITKQGEQQPAMAGEFEELKQNHSKIADELSTSDDDRDQLYYAINDVINQYFDWN